MWVYGDHVRTVAPRDALRAVADALEGGGHGPPPGLADVFVDAAAVSQALIDAEFEARGQVDARSPLADALMAALTGLACALDGAGPADPAPWRELASRVPAARLPSRLVEGFAFYAVHPVAYARAARAAGLGADARIVGVRSAGVGLAPMVAAAADAPPPVTVRPVGDPFARRLSLAPGFLAELASAAGVVAIVDEGPGLSGSSFQAVADALAFAGVARDRLLLLPSHDRGPGPRASPEARALWRGTPRAVVDPEWAAELPVLLADVTGPLTGPVRDVSGGAWRADLPVAQRPPAHTAGERRKLRLPARSGDVVARWAGLGGEAREKAERAGRLADAGLSPPVLALRDGWIVQPWIAGRPLDEGDAAPMVELASLLRLRAGWSAPDAGAPAATLAEMAHVNVGEALGPVRGARAARRVAHLLEGPRPPAVWIDGRLHRREWIRTAEGRTLKVDALDHARAHDLVGAQEIGWDVAGATVEWDLAPAAAAALGKAVGASAGRLPGLELAYLAFHLGAAASAAEAHGHAPDEQARLRREQLRYARGLERRLDDAR